MKIGILQTGYPPDPVKDKHGSFDVMFQRLLEPHGFTFQTWNVVDMQFPDGPEAADGWLITGSRHGAYEDHPFIPPLEDFIRTVQGSGRRMVGICFGHQIVAQALGGRVEKFAGGWAVGRRTYDFTALGDVHLNAWHQDQVVTLPEGAEVIGTNDFCANAALVYGDSILTVQAHPELSNPIIADYLAVRGDDPMYPRDMIAQALQDNTKPTDEIRVAALLADFLKNGQGAL
ncbi:type 1 glutamine amidotransferase [Celeribacter arenosi]|uniref:Type 1 glutamine amidotransferase n=1 Tax=Celeribacter arenosi TaxID=792649 RepID=A0ABP7K9M2_9RHOB